MISDEQILGLFEKLVEPLLAQLFSLAKKNNVLCRTRDLLLPKLISGEVDVEEINIDTERGADR